MTNCREITELATIRAEGGLDAAARRSFDEHLATCPGCRAYVGQLERTARALGALPPPELPDPLRGAILRQFDAWQARRAGERAPLAPVPVPAAGRRFAWEAFLALAALAALLVRLARSPSSALADWAVAATLAAGAVAVAAVARRLTLRFALLAVSAAFVAAAIRGGPGPLAVPQGVECLITEGAGAAVAAAGAWWAARRAPSPVVSVGAWAVAGALVADGVLQITCGEAASIAHLAVFHAGGVIVLAAALLLVARVWPRPRAASSRG